jgi:hypothetical protein
LTNNGISGFWHQSCWELPDRRWLGRLLKCQGDDPVCNTCSGNSVTGLSAVGSLRERLAVD